MGEVLLIAMVIMALGGGGDDDDDKPGRLPTPKPDPKPTPKPDGPVGPTEPKPEGPVGPGGVEPNKPTEPTEPKPGEDLPSVLDDYPTPGSLYQVVQGDTGALSAANGGIAHRAIADRAYRAGMAKNWTHEAALAMASARAKEFRTKYWLAIEGLEWNDRLYGTYGYGQQAMPNGVTKRAIRLLPQNADNKQRLYERKAPIRSILLSTPNNAKQGTGKAAPGAPSGHLELLLLPDIDGDALLDGFLVINDSGPPDWIKQLGVVDRSGAPASTKWGA